MTGMRTGIPGQHEKNDLNSMEALVGLPDADGAMDALCNGVSRILDVATRVPTKLSIRVGAASLDIEWAPPAVASENPVADPADPVECDTVAIIAPLVGTCYLASEPGAAPFISVGDRVEAGQQVAIIEAMKLMNPVLSEAAGEVVEILVHDAEAVEYGQRLFVLAPAVS